MSSVSDTLDHAAAGIAAALAPPGAPMDAAALGPLVYDTLVRHILLAPQAAYSRNKRAHWYEDPTFARALRTVRHVRLVADALAAVEAGTQTLVFARDDGDRVRLCLAQGEVRRVTVLTDSEWDHLLSLEGLPARLARLHIHRVVP